MTHSRVLLRSAQESCALGYLTENIHSPNNDNALHSLQCHLADHGITWRILLKCC